MPIKKISKGTQKAVSLSIDKIFEQLKLRWLGPQFAKVGKGVVINHSPQNSLGGIVVKAAYAANASHNPQVQETLENIAAAYLDATKERYRAKIFHAIQSGVVSGAPLEDVEASIKEVLTSAQAEVRRIVETETTAARNFSSIDAIGKVAAVRDIEDPTLFWVVLRDNTTCTTCLKLYLLDDGVTPRVWKQSELAHGYYKKGMNRPTVGPVHPNCRCQPTLILPGWGFNSSGRVEYISPGHDEFKKQREE